MTSCNELPRRFRMWIETLSIGTDDRPLQDILRKNGKVLCFNYTEFIETLYGFHEDNICTYSWLSTKEEVFSKRKD